MDAVILAAGEGIRMRPLTEHTPKPLLRVLDKPIIHHIIEELPDAIDRIILLVGYLKEQIEASLGNEFAGRPIIYVHQPGTRPIGTGSALELCRPCITGSQFLMLYADDLKKRSDIKACLEYPIAMLVKEVNDPGRFGTVTIDKNDYVTDIVEKSDRPPSNLVWTGVQTLDERIFNYYPLPQQPNGEYYVTDAFRGLMRDYPMKAIRASFWVPITCPQDIAIAEATLRKQI
jgi:bifunctional UDP-N-acetylglucosamine pyrophosphorylase/glucosamine-1-phosphate N-acetyltransferase